MSRRTKLVLAGLAGAALVAGAVVLVPPMLVTEASLLASARERIARNEPEAAQLQLGSLLQQHPHSAEGHFLLGSLLHKTGNAPGAEAELRRALDAGHPEAEALPLLAQTLLAQGKGPQLIEQFGQKSLPDAQANAEFRAWIAQALGVTGDLDGAEAAARQALRQSPDQPTARLVLVRLAAARGDLAAAQTQLQGLLSAQPGNVQAWVAQGDLALQKAGSDGDATPAIEAYRKALSLQPDQVRVHAAILNLLLARHDAEAAQKQWAAMAQAAPGQPETLFFEAVLADQRGDSKRTRELAQLLLRGAPDNPRVLLLAGQAELKLGSPLQAEMLLARALLATPRAATTRRLLATAQLQGGQPDKALATLRQLLDTQPPDAEAVALSAQAYMMTGDTRAAEAAFARASGLRPDDTRLQTALAATQLSRGQVAAGFKALEELAAKDKDVMADLALISARMRRNDTAGALRAADGLAAKTPKNPMADQLRGRIALQAQDHAAARRHFEAALAKQPQFMPAVSGLAMLDLADGKPDEARARFTRVLEANPKNSGAMQALAEINTRAGGRPELSAKWLDDAVKADPGDERARSLLIDHHLARRETDAALSAAQSAVAALPGSADLLERLGLVQLQLRDAQQAAASFTRLAQMLPQSPMPQLRLADALMMARNKAGAAAAVRRAQEIAPGAPAVQVALLTLAQLDDRPEQALAAARKLQAQRPDDATGFVMEGDAEMRGKRFDAAAAAYRKALARKDPGEAPLRLRTALLAAGKTAEADQFAAEWRQSHPGDMAFLLQMGDTARAAGHVAQAEQHYRAVLEKLPQQPVVLNNLAYVLALQKKPGAVALAEQALKLAPGASATHAALLDTLALALAAENQLPRALEVQAKAVAMVPGEPQYRLQLARLRIQSGDRPGARAELTELAQLGASFPRQAEVAALLKTTTD